MAAFEAWLVFLILVVNVAGELQRKRMNTCGQLRHRAVSLQQSGFLVCYLYTPPLQRQCSTQYNTTSCQCYRGFSSSSTSGGFQDGHPGLPVTVQHGSGLSVRRLSVGLRRRSSSAAFCHIEDVRCEANPQQLWRQVFCSCMSEAVEQPSS